ncbi:hypothetical protein [Streptomyces sp. NRRL B-24720]|uniref:hypothetical protein n=1 Tax=Streptomyces sp. NRRL B-24720 TaxID=1476876 RepID=UPI0004C9996F|nr:hypothetical protein [Streptomyces sp. NRRL B-24720]
MTASTLLPVREEIDLSEFELELQIAVTGDPSMPLTPEAGFTKVTCASQNQTSTIITCLEEGPICC